MALEILFERKKEKSKYFFLPWLTMAATSRATRTCTFQFKCQVFYEILNNCETLLKWLCLRRRRWIDRRRSHYFWSRCLLEFTKNDKIFYNFPHKWMENFILWKYDLIYLAKHHVKLCIMFLIFSSFSERTQREHT